MRDAASLACRSEPATTLTHLGYIVRGWSGASFGGGLLGLSATEPVAYWNRSPGSVAVGKRDSALGQGTGCLDMGVSGWTAGFI